MSTVRSFRTARALTLCLGLFASWPGYAQLLTFSQVPAGSTAREPAPNIIISVDDSGSMGWDVNGCVTTDWDRARYGNWQNDPAATVVCPAPSAASAGANTNPSRIASLRQALFDTFGNVSMGTSGLVGDDRIRLAWQAMWDNGRNLRPAGQTALQDSLTPGSLNTIKPFSGAHRTNFTNFINSMRPFNGTPSHRMFNNVTGYMGTTGVNGPYAITPGSTTAPELSCRRNYHIFMTDGAWNNESGNLGNADGTNRVLGDGTTEYNIQSAQTRLYRDTFGGLIGTLADISFHNWATDFRTDLPNNVRPLIRITANETIGTTVLQPFWNAKNNPMTWQGVTQYTIGFGNPATTWAGSPTWDATADNNYGAGYNTLVTGSANWQDLMPAGAANTRPMDLWHAALNGRGTYTPARTPADLSTAFQTILNDILTQTARPLVSVATNSSRLTAGGLAYVAGYDSGARWSGSLAAFPIDMATSRPSTTATWRAENLLNTSTFSVSSRVVLTHNGTQGRSFTWDNLSLAQQQALRGADPLATGTARVAYLRGDRSLEGGTMRTRSSRLGDIVNSNIWHTGRPTRMPVDQPGHATFRTAHAGRTPILYVGANDGMLHGFNALTGHEMVAYVPSGLYGNTTTSPLRELTRTAYTHRYYVDGSPFTGDANLGGSGPVDWRTVLIGTLGAGGKGYFVLDVTNPASFTDPGGAVSPLVLMDATATTNPHIGHIFATPVVDELTRALSEQIVRVNDSGTTGQRWAVLLGNGYNSTNQQPVLLIQYLDGARELTTLVPSSAPTGGGNGLGAPRPVDLNGDGKVDIVYAGDLLGNLWKFDLTASNPGSWRVGFGGNPLFTARDSVNNPQPITAAPFWMPGPRGQGGLQVLFGTGRNLTEFDTSDTRTQSVYSIWDMSTYSWAGTSPVTGTDLQRITATRSSVLVEQSQTGSPAGPYFRTSSNAVTYNRLDPGTQRGWYFDFPVPRERALNHAMHFEGEQVLVSSTVPTSSIVGETCDLSALGATAYLTAFNMYSGRPPQTQIFGVDNGNRVLFGSGDYGLLRDIPNNKWTFFTPEATCSGDGCGSPPPPPPPPGGPCGGLSGPFLQACNLGVGGQRADWRELR